MLHITDVVIGLDPNIYNVNEGNGTVSLTLRLLRGIINPGYNFFIRITTDDDSAQGKLHVMNCDPCITIPLSLQLH